MISLRAAARLRSAAILMMGMTLFATAGFLFAGGQQASDTRGTQDADVTDGETIEVFVSVLPQRYFVERIAGDRARVTVLVPAGSSPATYDPTPRQVNAIGNADVWFRIGVPFEEGFLPEIRDNLPDLRIVDTREGIELRQIDDHTHADEGDDNAEDEHHHEGEDDHAEDEHAEDGHAEGDQAEDGHHDEGGSPDPHIWLGPEEVKRQAATLRDALVSMDPDNSDAYRQGYAAFAEDIDELEAELEKTLEPLRGESFFVYHPAFGYLLDGYGIEQVAIETGGVEPTPQQMREMIRRGQAEGARVVFVQPEFSQTAARRVAEALDAEVIEVNPLAPDWLTNMRRLGERIREGVEEGSSGDGA
ncbi:MAG: metal ABC transporter solute-binding protein, Zn/Mn family [Spirochaetota bacterium]